MTACAALLHVAESAAFSSCSLKPAWRDLPASSNVPVKTTIAHSQRYHVNVGIAEHALKQSSLSVEEQPGADWNTNKARTPSTCTYMQQRIALEELNRDLGAAKCRFDTWAKGKIWKAEEIKEVQKRTVEADRAQLASLEEGYEEIKRQAQQIEERLNAERDEEDCISREVAERKKEVERAEDHLLIWQKSLEKESREVALKEQDVAVELGKAKAKLSSVNSEMQRFRDWLGLRIVRSEGVEGELLLIFQQVNPNDHNMEYTVGICLQQNQQYDVTSCRPDLPAINTLLAELNATGHFGDFVKAVRKEFKQL